MQMKAKSEKVKNSYVMLPIHSSLDILIYYKLDILI